MIIRKKICTSVALPKHCSKSCGIGAKFEKPSMAMDIRLAQPGSTVVHK